MLVLAFSLLGPAAVLRSPRPLGDLWRSCVRLAPHHRCAARRPLLTVVRLSGPAWPLLWLTFAHTTARSGVALCGRSRAATGPPTVPLAVRRVPRVGFWFVAVLRSARSRAPPLPPGRRSSHSDLGSRTLRLRRYRTCPRSPSAAVRTRLRLASRVGARGALRRAARFLLAHGATAGAHRESNVPSRCDAVRRSIEETRRPADTHFSS